MTPGFTFAGGARLIFIRYRFLASFRNRQLIRGVLLHVKLMGRQMGQSTPINTCPVDDSEYYLLLTCLRVAAARLSKEQVLELADTLFDELRARRSGAGEHLHMAAP